MACPGRCVALAAAIWLGSCGYVGDPLPPALRIPVSVTDLAAVQRGDAIILQFTLPRMTTEGVVLKRLGSLDLRAGTVGTQPFHRDTWEAHASRLETPAAPASGPVRVETPAAAWTGQEVTIAVRVSNRKGRWSEWSNFVALRVVPPVSVPSELAAQAVPAGVRLSWQDTGQRPDVKFRIYRRAGDSEEASLVAQTESREWVDTQTGYGETYVYRVQAVVPAGDREAESEITPPVSVTPEDRFSPAVPSELTAVAGLDSIELAWDRSQEADFVFYRLYRSASGGPMQRIADLLVAPSYSDRAITSGERYRYAVSSVDRLGNESAPSATAEEAAP